MRYVSFLILLNKFLFVTDLLDNVYVDELKGTNSQLCGANRSTPCKSLSEGLEKAEEFGIFNGYSIPNWRISPFIRSRQVISDEA